MDKLQDIYTDYLIGSFGPTTTATNLSSMLEEEISHDEITRFLSRSTFPSITLWLSVKSAVRDIEKIDGVLIFNHTIVEKLHTKENDKLGWSNVHSCWTFSYKV